MGRLITEQQNPQSARIDQLNTSQILQIINRQDAQVAAAVAKELPAIARSVDTIVDRLRRGGRLLYIGAGSSGRLGVLDAAECPPTYNAPPSLVQGIMAGGMRALHRATEASEDQPALGRRDLQRRRISARDAVVGITASGRTPYVIGALRYARSRGAAAIAVTSNPHSEVAAVADITITTVVGPEVIAGSSRMKSGTAQKMVLNMLSTAAMVRLGHVYGNFMVNVHLKNRKLVERARTILRRLQGISRAAADAALRRADGDLKVAIIMERTGLDRAAAQALLRRHKGHLAHALANHSSLKSQVPSSK